MFDGKEASGGFGRRIPPRDAAPSAAPASGTILPSRERHVLRALGTAVYEWSLADDRLVWSGDAASLLRLDDPAVLASGRGFAERIAPETPSKPREVVMSAAARSRDGGSYEALYAFIPRRGGDERLWIEDIGRWLPGPAGRPAVAQGMIRVVAAPARHLARTAGEADLIERSQFLQGLGEAIGAAVKDGQAVGVLIVAIDGFGTINDVYGIDVADEVGESVARRLRSRMRGGDIFGRFGPSRFALILRHCSESDLAIAAERLRCAVRDEPVRTTKGSVPVTLSLGGVVAPRHAATAEAALQAAKEAAEAAKRRGRDSFVSFHHVRARAAERARNLRLADDVICALNDHRIRLAYQPIVRADTGETVVHEALIRLDWSDGSEMSAGDFLPAAERLGLARLIDHRVLELAIRDLVECSEAQLAINISAETADSPDWVASLIGLLRRERTAAERLTVEITETAAIRDIEEATRFVKTLRDIGCRVAIDDFGAGYTSFRNLKALPVDMVKIDGSFVTGLAGNPHDQAFVRALLELARAFGLETVAEWVDDEQAASLLRGWGVNYLQGHLFGAASRDRPWAGDSAAPAVKAAG